MNSYELSRKWFDWCFDNASKIRPIHTALFFFIIEHNNRLGWKKEFGLPRDMAMDAIGVKNNKTYSSAFNDLEEWKFINVIERSKNQYSANIISLFGCVKNTPPTTSALDEAMLKHLHKQRTSTTLGIAPIDKPNNIETSKHYISEIEFLEDWNTGRVKILRVDKSLIKKLSYDELVNFKKLRKTYTIEDFKNAIRGLLKQKGMFPVTQLRPKHLLEDGNMDKYIDAHANNKQLFDDKNEVKKVML